MLLILAGVALATLTGQGNIIGNAENAVGKYNNSVASEQQLLNEIEKYFIEHTNGGEVQDTNNPIVTATEGEETITEGTSIEISSYFTYSANGTAEITNVTYTDTSNGDAVVANTNTLTVGTHIIKCTVTKETGAVASATKTIIVENKLIILDAGDISNNPEEHFGGYVTNYTTPSGDPNVQWRIFYADESNVYLIASDYIHYDYAPTSANNTLYDNGNGYQLSFDNVYKDYTGSADITDPRITKWISYVSENPSSINAKIKALAFMLDEARWSAKYANPDYAEYAIGGPTLELWCASYKATHPDKYVECSYDDTGYLVKWSDSTSSPSWNETGAEDDNDLYYIKSSTDKAYSMWLASPSAESSSGLMCVDCSGSVYYNGYYGYSSTGFRPIVCLQSGITLEKQTDGTYLIK